MQDSLGPLISVIMPVYNSEKYVSEAIQSVMDQSFQDWELICVDDGSTDNSLAILHSFAKNDNRIKVVAQKNSGTASAARNKALEYATGEYIALLDSDDQYDNETLNIIQKRIEETNADYILFNTCFCSEDLQEINRELKGLNGNTTSIITGRRAFLESLEWNIGGFGITRQNVVKNLKYNEDGMNGDELSTRLFFLNSKSVTFSEAKYFYRIFSNSTTRKFSVKRFFTLDTDLALLKIIFSNEWANHLLPSFEKKYYMKIYYFMVLYFRNKKKLSFDEKLYVKEYLHKHYVEAKKFTVNRQPHNSKTALIVLILSKINYPIFLILTYVVSWRK